MNLKMKRALGCSMQVVEPGFPRGGRLKWDHYQIIHFSGNADRRISEADGEKPLPCSMSRGRNHQAILKFTMLFSSWEAKCVVQDIWKNLQSVTTYFGYDILEICGLIRNSFGRYL